MLAASEREFTEETRLAQSGPFRFLTTVLYSFTHNGEERTHQRSYFHVALDGDLPESWINIE